MKSKSLHKLLANIQGGLLIRRRDIDVPKSRLNLEVLNLLYLEGFIDGFSISLEKPHCFRVFLKYINEKPVLRKLRVVSTASRKVYITHKKIVSDLVFQGLFVISTSANGLILSDRFVKNFDFVKKSGGKILFEIVF